MPKKTGLLDGLRKKLKRTIDEALEEAEETTDSEEETEDEDEKGGTQTGDAAVNRQILKMLKTMDARMTALEKKKTKDSDDPEKTGDEDTEDEETETKDDILNAEKAEKLSEEGVHNHTGDSLSAVLSRAEILAPGIKLPTLDSANNGKAVLNAKRAALKQAYATADGQKAIAPFIGIHTDFSTMPARTIDVAFTGAAELIKQQNNAAGVRSGISTKDWGRAAPSPADINARNREFWNKGK